MASLRERGEPAEETVLRSANGGETLSDEEWPVSDLYRVEPEREPAVEVGTASVVEEPAATAPRRFLPDVRRRSLLAIAVIMAALILGAILLDRQGGGESSTPAAAGGVPEGTSPETTATPPAQTLGEQPEELVDLSGLTVAAARGALDELGFRSRIVRIESDEPTGRVVRQAPSAGAALDGGAMVVLFVARDAAAQEASQVDVPDVVGRSSSDAVVAVRDVGLVPRIRLVDSSERAGSVIRQKPQAGVDAKSRSTVELFVARARPAPAGVSVPDVLGLTAGAAQERLRTAGLEVTVERVRSPRESGTVIRQAPGPGAELRKGGVVTMTVSTGPALVDVPDVVGLDEQSARLALESAGFLVQISDEPAADPAQDGTVLSQAPGGGSRAAEGAVVTLVVARAG